MTPEYFRALMKSWRASLPPRSRSRTKAPKSNMRFPKHIERQYSRSLSRMFKYYTAPLMERLPAVLAQELRTDGIQMDTLMGDMENWDTHVYYNYVDPAIGAKGVEATIATYGWETSTYSQKQWKQLLSVALPDAFPLDEPWVADALDNWTKHNATLVDNAVGQFFGKTEAIVRDAVTKGRRAEDVLHDIRALDDKLTRNQAQFIARDQIGTLNGILTQKRNEAAGIDKYTWATAMDERVRGRPGGKWEYSKDTHWIMEGKLCRWDNPTVYSDDGGKSWKPRSGLKAIVTYHGKTSTGTRGTPGPKGNAGKSMVAVAPDVHPGIAPNCRCGSRAMLDDYIAELDAELRAESIVI